MGYEVLGVGLRGDEGWLSFWDSRPSFLGGQGPIAHLCCGM